MENSTKTDKSLKQKLFSFFPPLTIAGILVGAIGGYIYYAQVGCASGTCAITSNPYMSILWGGMIGYLLGDMFRKKIKTRSKNRGVKSHSRLPNCFLASIRWRSIFHK